LLPAVPVLTAPALVFTSPAAAPASTPSSGSGGGTGASGGSSAAAVSVDLAGSFSNFAVVPAASPTLLPDTGLRILPSVTSGGAAS